MVIVVQENRSFDNLFQGFPEADTRSYGYDSYGRKIKLKPIDLGILWDVDHEYASFMDACNGTGSYPGTDCRMNGFNKEMVYCGTGSYPPCPIRHPQYAYVPQSETKPYFDTVSYTHLDVYKRQTLPLEPAANTSTLPLPPLLLT